MLEIFGIMMLCKANKKNALARGKRPGGFIALTIILWVGLELVGFFVGALTEIEYGSILFGYGFAGLGALISFLLAKFGPKGDYVDPSIAVNPQYGAPAYVPGNTPAYMAPQQPVQPQEYVHVNNPYQAPAQQSSQYCEFCGEPLKPGSKFCASCGTKINFPVDE